MLSYKLVQTIEDHCPRIIDAVIREIRRDPELPHLRQLSTAELREWGCSLLRNLGEWLVAGQDPELAGRYEGLAQLRFEESVPLHEAVHGLHILRSKTIDFVRNDAFGFTAYEACAQEELAYQLDRFFDWLVDHLVRGYEDALRFEAQLAP